MKIKLAETTDSPVAPPREGARRPYLEIENGTDRTLSYRAIVRYKGSKEFVETTGKDPIPGGESGYICWGFEDQVEEIVLYQFRVTKKPVN